MKLILPALIAIVSITSCTSKTNDIKEAGLNGDILSINSSSYEAIEKFGDITKGQLIHTSTDSFNSDGNVEKSTYVKMPKDDLKEKTSITNVGKFDSEGRLAEVVNPATKHVIEKYKYDENNHRIQTDVYNDSATIKETIKYKIADNGLMTESKSYTGGRQNSRTILRYNENKKLIETVRYDSANDKETTTYTYNTKGLLTKYKYHSKDWNFSRSFKYVTFDDKDNWIKRLTYFDDKLNEIEIRKFQYK